MIGNFSPRLSVKAQLPHVLHPKFSFIKHRSVTISGILP
jgi:hypothetical protein